MVKFGQVFKLFNERLILLIKFESEVIMWDFSRIFGAYISIQDFPRPIQLFEIINDLRSLQIV